MSEAKMPPFQVTLEAPDPCRRVLKVLVPRQEFDRQYQQRLTAAVRDHQRPGFRKGKTPRTIVEKELGGRLRVDTFEALVSQAYRAAIIEHRLYPLAEPGLENLVFEDGQDLSFDLEVEVRPDVTASHYEGLPVVERRVEVSGAQIDEVLDRLRENRAVYEPVDRPAADGDRVVLDLVPLAADGTPEEDRRAAGQRVTVGAEQNLPAFNEALPGVVAGDRRDLSVPHPEDYPNGDLAGRTVAFRLEIGAVESRILPELDDAFAAQLEPGQTLLELRGRIREGLEAEARRRLAEDLDEQVLEQLIAANEVPVPPTMIASMLQTGLEDLHRRRQHSGGQTSAEEDAMYREAARPIAERQIKGMFLLEAVRRQESIEVGDEEVEARIEAIAAEHGFDLAKYRAYLEQGEEKDRIRQAVIERKVYDFLLSRARVTREESPAAEQEQG